MFQPSPQSSLSSRSANLSGEIPLVISILSSEGDLSYSKYRDETTTNDYEQKNVENKKHPNNAKNKKPKPKNSSRDDDLLKQMEEKVENKKHPKNAKNKKPKKTIIRVKRRNEGDHASVSLDEKKERGIFNKSRITKAFRWGKNKNSKGAKPTLHEGYSLSTGSQQSASHWQNNDDNNWLFFRTGQNEYVDNVNRTPNSPYRDSNLRQFVDNDEHNFIDNVNSRTHFPSLGPFGHVLSLTPPTHLYNKETSDHPAVVPQTTRTRSPTGIMRNPSEVAIRNFGAKNTRSKSYNFSDNGALMNGSSSSSAAEIFGSAFETNLIDSESTESQSNGTKPSKNWAQELKALFDQDDSSSVASSYMTPFSSSMIPVICCTAQYKNNYVIDPATSAALLKDETFSYGDIE
jgi:hypothetical protein